MAFFAVTGGLPGTIDGLKQIARHICTAYTRAEEDDVALLPTTLNYKSKTRSPTAIGDPDVVLQALKEVLEREK